MADHGTDDYPLENYAHGDEDAEVMFAQPHPTRDPAANALSHGAYAAAEAAAAAADAADAHERAFEEVLRDS